MKILQSQTVINFYNHVVNETRKMSPSSACRVAGQLPYICETVITKSGVINGVDLTGLLGNIKEDLSLIHI